MAKRLIYAEDVLQILDRDKAYMSDVGRIHAKNAVNEAPTVDAKPVVHGRWKEGYLIHKYGCSCCWKRQDRISPYCPNCGADMRGEEE